MKDSSQSKSNFSRKKGRNKFLNRNKLKNPSGRELFERLPTYLKPALITQAPDYIIYAVLVQKYCVDNKKIHDNPVSYINSELHLKPEYARYGEQEFSDLKVISSKWYLQALKIIFDSKNKWISAETSSRGPIAKIVEFIKLIDQAEMLIHNFDHIKNEAHEENDRVLAAQELYKRKLKEERDKELNDLYDQALARANVRAEDDINLHLKRIKMNSEDFYKMLEKPEHKIWVRQNKYDSHHDVRIFLRSCLSPIDEPLIATLFRQITIQMWDILENRYEIQIINLNINSYLYILYKYNEYNFLEEISKQTVNSPTGFFDLLDSTLRFNEIKINRIEYNRPPLELSFEAWLLPLMAPANEREITDAFFYRPEFFHFKVECKTCGATLKNVISALNQKGPVCGDHRYIWAKDHVPKVVELILKKSKSGAMYLSNNPVIELRTQSYFEPITRHENNIPWLRNFLNEPELNPRTIENLVRMRVGRRYYS